MGSLRAPLFLVYRVLTAIRIKQIEGKSNGSRIT